MRPTRPIVLAALLAALSAGAAAQTASAPLPLPLNTTFVFDPSRFRDFCQVYYTTVPANTYRIFAVCSEPEYALAATYLPSESIPASSPIPSTVPCHLPEEIRNGTELKYLAVSFPTVPVNSSSTGGICQRQDQFAAPCRTTNATVFISFASRWNATYSNGSAVPADLFNPDSPRNITVNLLPSRERPGEGNATGCAAFVATTTTRPAAAGRMAVGILQSHLTAAWRGRINWFNTARAHLLAPAGLLDAAGADADLLATYLDADRYTVRFLGIVVSYGVIRTLLVTMVTLAVALFSVLNGFGVTVTLSGAG
ncbi:hypothetical protein DFJ74DRAFT_771637, partial [Hyaloraphidium curvatum]